MTTTQRTDGWWQASDGRWYPPQPMPPWPPPATAAGPKKRHTGLWVALVVLAIPTVLVVVLLAAAVSFVVGTSSNKTVRPIPAAIYKIGDTATTSGWVVSVYGITDPWTSTSQFESPTAGGRFVRVDLQVRNTKATQEIFSSLASSI